MLGIIGGSGSSRFAALQNTEEVLRSTAYGMPSSALVTGTLAGQPVVFLARHGNPHCIAPHNINYRANLMALQQAGVTQVVAVNAVGGIGQPFVAGSICVPHQIIDYTWGRAHTYCDEAGEPLQHIDFTEPYSESLRQRLLEAAAASKLAVIDHAVHGVTQGPRLETAAEIRRMQKDGCDIVGMTGMPEAALARELGLDYACLAVVVNPAAGLSAEPITMAAIEQVMAGSMQQVQTLLGAYCQQE